MAMNLRIVRVNSDYCDYLRSFDNRVSYNKNEKELRPFIGILFVIEDCEYFAPLSSKISKIVERAIDLVKFKLYPDKKQII